MQRIMGLFLVLFAVVGFSQSHAATGDPVLINEVIASHTGTDDTEFIEFFGTPGTSLDGLSLIVVEGDAFGPGTIDRRIDFGPTDILGSNGFYLVGNPVGLAADYGVTPNIPIANNFFENSSLTVALVETDSISGGFVTGAEVVLDTVGLNDGDPGDQFFFAAPIVGPDGPFFPAGARRLVDGVDTDTIADWEISDFYLGPDNTPTAGIIVNTPPDCSGALSSIETLWPPNHTFFAVEVLGVTDADGDALTIAIDSIFQDEPVDTFGDGRFTPDGKGVGTTTAKVRAERVGSKKMGGNGRVYHIGFTADDGNGGTCSGEVLVGVPKSKGKKHRIPVDDGPLYDSTALTP